MEVIMNHVPYLAAASCIFLLYLTVPDFLETYRGVKRLAVRDYVVNTLLLIFLLIGLLGIALFTIAQQWNLV
jgi:hypothetical protein